MTDKQIIIDGVPVQDCCYFDYENDGYEDSCYIHQNECSAQNCYYKQLARKTQECEQLKEINAEIQESEIELENMKNSLFIDYMKYKQAIEEIKAIAEKIYKAYEICDFGCDSCEAKQIIQKCEEVNKQERTKNENLETKTI